MYVIETANMEINRVMIRCTLCDGKLYLKIISYVGGGITIKKSIVSGPMKVVVILSKGSATMCARATYQNMLAQNVIQIAGNGTS